MKIFEYKAIGVNFKKTSRDFQSLVLHVRNLEVDSPH